MIIIYIIANRHIKSLIFLNQKIIFNNSHIVVKLLVYRFFHKRNHIGTLQYGFPFKVLKKILITINLYSTDYGSIQEHGV